MLIPIFGSCPTYLTPQQEEFKRYILSRLGHEGLEWRSLGQTDYPEASPLKGVHLLAKHCSGGLILGFSQFETKSGIWKKNTPYMKKQNSLLKFPTAWNQLEGGIIFALGLPLLIFREDTLTEDGIFDKGVSDRYINHIPKGKIKAEDKKR